MHTYFIYILANLRNRIRPTLYVGVTNDLERRLNEHRHLPSRSFARKYNVDSLVYFETTSDVSAAIAREKQIKGWRREKKIALIESRNPSWVDLSVRGFLATPGLDAGSVRRASE